MNMVDVVQWLRRPDVARSMSVRTAPSTPNLLCPHCEKPLGKEHDDAGCRRRMSRRFFFGAMAGGVAAAIAAPVVVPEILKAIEVPIQAATKDLFWVAKWSAEEDGVWGTVVPFSVGMTFNGANEMLEIFSKIGEQLGPEVSDLALKRTSWVTIEKGTEAERGWFESRIRNQKK